MWLVWLVNGWWVFWCKPRGYEVPGGCWLGLLVGLFTGAQEKKSGSTFSIRPKWRRKKFPGPSLEGVSWNDHGMLIWVFPKIGVPKMDGL